MPNIFDDLERLLALYKETMRAANTAQPIHGKQRILKGVHDVFAKEIVAEMRSLLKLYGSCYPDTEDINHVDC